MAELRPHHIKTSRPVHEGEANLVEIESFRLIAAQRNGSVRRGFAIAFGVTIIEQVTHFKVTDPCFITPAAGASGSVFEDEQAVLTAPGTGTPHTKI